MDRPKPSQYDLAEPIVAYLDTFEERTSTRIFVYLLAIAALVGFSFGFREASTPLGRVLLGTLYAFGSVAGAFMPGMVLTAIWPFVAGLFSRNVRNYSRYRNALRGYNAWERRTKTAFWQTLSGLRFEAELALLFRQAGYNVQLTPPTGDKGVDIVLERDGLLIIVQCKATSKPVGPAVARELYGTLVASGAHEAILAVTGGLSRGAREFLRDKRIHVMTLSDIMILQANPSAYPERLRIARMIA